MGAPRGNVCLISVVRGKLCRCMYVEYVQDGGSRCDGTVHAMDLSSR